MVVVRDGRCASVDVRLDDRVARVVGGSFSAAAIAAAVAGSGSLASIFGLSVCLYVFCLVSFSNCCCRRRRRRRRDNRTTPLTCARLVGLSETLSKVSEFCVSLRLMCV